MYEMLCYNMQLSFYGAAGPQALGPALGPRLGTGPGRRRLVFCIYLVYPPLCLALCQAVGVFNPPLTSA